jgi:hypothetical protein
VASLNKNKIEISFPAVKIVGVWGVGKQAFGRLVLIGSPEKGANIFNLKGSFQGAIVVFSGPLTFGFWHKAVSIGVVGIICGKLPDEQFGKKIETEFLRIWGRKMRIAPPLLVMGEGKRGVVRKEIWQVLVGAEQKTVIIQGGEKCLLIPRED